MIENVQTEQIYFASLLVSLADWSEYDSASRVSLLMYRLAHNWCYNKAWSYGWRNGCKGHFGKPLAASEER